MNYKEATKIYKALANERRLHIVNHLQKVQIATVNDIADELNLSFDATSKHLQKLKSVKIVQSHQISLEQNYSLATPIHSYVKLFLDSLK